MLPNFFVVGDVKAGTTSLYDYLKQHPEIFMSTLKEPRFFAFDKDNPYHVQSKTFPIRTLSEYKKLFLDGAGFPRIGEASPNYLRSINSADRIKRLISNAKIIVSLRNPADRLFSLYQMHYRSGRTKKKFEQLAFQESSNWIKGNAYFPELDRFYRMFSKEQIKIILFEEMVSNPIKNICDLYQFLNVDPGFMPILEVHNKGGVPRNVAAYRFAVTIKNGIKKFVAPTTTMKRVWSSFKQMSLRSKKLDPSLRAKVLEVCRDDIGRTENLISRDLSLWTKHPEGL